MRQPSMADWIHEALTDIDKVDENGVVQPCTALVLFHMSGTDENEVHPVKLGLKTSASRTPRDLEELFMGKAKFRARCMNGVQTFNLVAFYAHSVTPGARMVFTVVPPTMYGENGLTTESPTATGQLQQGMRHQDMTFLQMFRQQAVNNEIISGFADRQSRHVERLEAENRETFVLLKDIMKAQLMDRHERDKELLQMERHTKIIEQVMKYGPLLANMVTGRDLFPQNTADTTLVETIAEHITPDRAAKVMEALGDQPLVMAMLMSRLEQYHKQRTATETAIQKRPPPGAANGELDAAGLGVQ